MAKGGGARKYVRDNRGRFAAVGATARGGRLKTAGGSRRATQTRKIQGRPGNTISKPRGLQPGAVKPKATKGRGWLQSTAARKDRTTFAADRSREARFLKSLPKPTRQAIRLANRTRNNFVGAKYRAGINEGATLLRSNFGSRKGLTKKAAESVSSSMQYSARRLKAAVALPSYGPRLRKGSVSGSRDKASVRYQAKSTIGKPRGLRPGAVKPKPARRTPATSSLRPGELMNANARPVNTMARFRKGESPYNRFSGHNEENLAKAEAWLKKKGRNATTYNDPEDRAIARGNLGGNNIYLNKAAQEYWSNPRRRSIEGRRSGFYSTSHPLGLLHHEIGHNKHKGGSALWYLSGSAKTWSKGIVPHSEWAKSITPAEARQQTPLGKIKLGKQKEALARRVSRYAATNPVEFVAETYAGLRTGRRYDSQVMRAYREAQGLSPRPAARRRSRLPKRSKS